jgi:hypothetical protein
VRYMRRRRHGVSFLEDSNRDDLIEKCHIGLFQG